MRYDLKNKIIVVTGAADGLGFGITDSFLENGAKVVIILDIDESKGIASEHTLNTKHGPGRVIFIKCDVTKDLEQVSSKIFNSYKVDILVNSAGVLDENNFRKMMEVNAIALVEFSMKFWEHMRTDNGGHGGTIINIGSSASYLKNDPFLVFYKTSKYPVMGFSNSLGNEYNFNKFGVRVVILCPGLTRTKLTAQQMCWDEHLERFSEFSKTASWQEVEDVGKAAVEVYNNADSGTAWSIKGGVLSKVL